MKIGILGGGQLGRMFIQEALKYDDELYVLDPDQNCPCSQISRFTKGDYNSYEEVLNFGLDKDIITIEIENVNVEALEALEQRGVSVIPSPSIIKIIQQKILQKEFYKKHGIPSPEYTAVWEMEGQRCFELPFVQKLNKGGYDGKGVQVIEDQKDCAKLWQEPSVIEKLVDIEKELSIIVAKNSSGEVKTFPVTEMVADERLNLLDFNICPAKIEEQTEKQIQEICSKFLQSIEGAGLFAIELFLDRKGKVWVNETAPRLHNSGHQSQEGNANSQFEQLYRVIKDLPLADTEARLFSGMLNLVGEEGYTGKVEYQGLEEVLRLPDVYVHLYGKVQTKPGRKMGHINILADTREELLQRLSEVKGLVKVVSR